MRDDILQFLHFAFHFAVSIIMTQWSLLSADNGGSIIVVRLMTKRARKMATVFRHLPAEIRLSSCPWTSLHIECRRKTSHGWKGLNSILRWNLFNEIFLSSEWKLSFLMSWQRRIFISWQDQMNENLMTFNLIHIGKLASFDVDFWEFYDRKSSRRGNRG